MLGGVLILRLWKDIDMFAAWTFGYRQNGHENGIGSHKYNHLRNTIAVWMREPKSWLRMAMQCSRLLWKLVAELM